MQMTHSERCIAMLLASKQASKQVSTLLLVSQGRLEVGAHSQACTPARMSGRHLKIAKLAFTFETSHLHLQNAFHTNKRYAKSAPATRMQCPRHMESAPATGIQTSVPGSHVLNFTLRGDTPLN